MSSPSRFALAAVPILFAAVTLVPAAPPEKTPAAINAVPANAFAVVSLDVARIWDHKAFEPVREARGKAEFAWVLQSLVGLPPAEIDRVTLFWAPPPTGSKEPAGPFLLISGRKAVNAKEVASTLARRGSLAPAKPADPRILTAPGSEFPYIVPLDDKTLLMAPAGTDAKRLAVLADAPPATDHPLLHTAGKAALVVGVVPSALAGLPLPVDDKLLAAKAAVLTADFTGEKTARATLRLDFADAAAAKAAMPLLKAKLDELGSWFAIHYKQEAAKPTEGAIPAPLLELLAATMKATKVATHGTAVTAAADIDLGDTIYRFLLAVPDSAFAVRGTSAAENNLKQIALAWHNFDAANGNFPANIYDKDGKALLSWRVQILPFIEQDNVYKQFKLDEPWDSPANKRWSELVIKTFQIPGRPAGGANETYFRTFILPKGAKPTDGRPLLTEGENKGPKIPAAFPDGTSNTWLVVEAAESVPWAKPDDLPYDGKLPLPALGGPNGKYSVAFADGSVRTFRRGQIDETNMRRLITLDDGEVVNIPDR